MGLFYVYRYQNETAFDALIGWFIGAGKSERQTCSFNVKLSRTSSSMSDLIKGVSRYRLLPTVGGSYWERSIVSCRRLMIFIMLMCKHDDET